MIEFRTLGTLDLRVAAAAPGQVLTQPKRIALLAYLATAPSGAFRRRDIVLALFWPELDQDRARSALRQATHALRRSLGDEAIVSRGEGEIAAASVHIWCDGPAFRSAIAASRLEEALDLYRGEFLPGLFVSDAPGFDEWLDGERRELAALALGAAWKLADREDAAGNAACLQWAHRAVALAPTDERGIKRAMTLLARYGDRAGALDLFQRYTKRLAEELEMAPSPELKALAESLKSQGVPAVLVHHAPSAPPRPTVVPAPDTPRPSPWWRPAAVAAGAVFVVGVVLTQQLRAGNLRSSLVAVAPRSAPAADVQQVVARRFYEEGTRELALGNTGAARRLLRTAVQEDSSFALAMLALAQLTESTESRLLAARALAYADSATDEERLEIRTRWAFDLDEPARLAYAETLAIRYPGNGFGRLMMGRALVGAARFGEAVPHLRSVIDAGAEGLAGKDPRCLACDAYSELMTAYELLDSLDASVRVGREWAARQPRSPRPWGKIAYAYACMRRYEDALAALRSMTDRGNDASDDPIPRVEVLLRAGDFATADAILLDRMRHATPDARSSARWLYWISLRDQGRYREALRIARAMREDDIRRSVDKERTRLHAAMPVALMQLEMGRHRESAALFDSIAAVPFTDVSVARSARSRAGNLTYAASGYAAAGDTIGLAARADSVRRIGGLSAYARDQRYHHHVRGLLLQARGEHSAAANEFRRALYSPLGGFIRTNLELGRSALAAGRHREAIYFLEAGARGPVGASGTHAPKTELYYLLAQAYDASGDRANALATYRRVYDAWENADPELRSRRALAELRLRELERSR